MPKISVIVPVYKVEDYLDRCVKSILAQTFADFELILVDDGSPDNCPAMCDEWAKKDNRIIVIHQENGGLSAARNAGIDWAFANSDSEWLSFVDSDDWVHPCFLEYLYRAVCDSGCLISICDVDTISTDSTEFLTLEYSTATFDSMEFYLNDKGLLNTVACNKLYHKSIFKDIRYPVGKIREDEFVTYKLLYKTKSVIFISSALYLYFQRNDSIMNNPSPKNTTDCILALLERIEFWRKHNETIVFESTVSSCFSLCYVSLTNPNRNVLGNKQAEKFTKRCFQRALLKYAKHANVSSKSHIHYYEIAFPRTFFIYWTYIGILNKFKK